MARITLHDARGAEHLDSRDLIEILDAELSSFEEGDFELACAVLELAEYGIEDWEYGAQLIREDCFEDYARELADDIGAVDHNAGWPTGYIDWERAAAALATDYVSVDFLGYSYYVR